MDLFPYETVVEPSANVSAFFIHFYAPLSHEKWPYSADPVVQRAFAVNFLLYRKIHAALSEFLVD